MGSLGRNNSNRWDGALIEKILNFLKNDSTIIGIIITVISLFITIMGVHYARAQLMESRKPKSPPKMPDSAKLDTLRRVRVRGILRVGCLWYPPFVDYKIDSGITEAYGLYPTILASLARDEGIKVQYSVLKWHEAIKSLERGDVDVVACVLKSAERRERCEFAGKIFRVGVGAVVRRGQTKITDHGDLARTDVTIAVTKGEIGWCHATKDLEINDNAPRLTVLEDKSIQTMMTLVVSGNVDCALADSLSCAQYIRNSGLSAVLEDVFASNPVHVEDNCLMLAKGNMEFRSWLDDGIKLIRSMPEVRELEKSIEFQYKGVLRRSDTSNW